MARTLSAPSRLDTDAHYVVGEIRMRTDRLGPQHLETRLCILRSRMSAAEVAKFGALFAMMLRRTQPRRWLRLGLRLRSVVTGAIAPLSHELVELGPVLGKAQALQKLLKLALFFLKPAQRIDAIFVESAIAA